MADSPFPSCRRLTGAIRSLVILVLAVCLLPAAGFARPTSADQAGRLARYWLARNAHPLGARLGSQVKDISTFRDSSGQALYFVVSLAPEGFVIITADDLMEPILAFAPHGIYDPAEKNPLAALVSRDVPRRLARARQLEQQDGDTAMPSGLQGFRRKWTELQGGSAADDQGADALASVSDQRVAPFVVSKWSQENEGSQACYNYYTPPNAEGNVNNYPCGCVATAMAQAMRFFQWPTTGVGTASFTITVNGQPQSRALRGGNASGGPYDWANMPLDPNGSTSTVQRQAIGALSADAGVAANMDYTADGSGASLDAARTALHSTFGYANVMQGSAATDTIPTASLTLMINPNLDASLPVILGIFNATEGHAVVADGYGYDTGTLYHHLNLGWAGTADAWYNLPTINTAYYSFNEVGDCLYNLYPSGSGEIISGRVLDAGGHPVSGATVKAIRTGGSTYNGVTNAKGIYALAKVPSSSSYTISAAKPGYAAGSRSASTGKSQNYANVGNLWQIDFTLRKTSLSPILNYLLLTD